MKLKRASLLTHGCRLNQSETEIIKQQLQQRGYELTPFGETTDLAIINTCTVTQEAETKCRQSIRKVIRNNPDAFVAVIGCYSQTGAETIAKIGGVDLIIGNQDKMSVLDYIEYGKNQQPVILRERIDHNDFSISFVGDLPSTLRANLKVQDGCDFGCAFCIIPRARGRARSRDFSNLIDEAQTLVKNGVKEIILTGVNIGTFSSHGTNFLNLIDHLNTFYELKRIRISSIEPTTVPLEIFDRMKSEDHALMPYLHLPLQSGSDHILQKMRRRYTLKDYTDFIEKATEAVPRLCLGTDIMVGHPGERESDFEQTCATFEKYPFAYCHVFPYSEREGTPIMRHTAQEQFVPVKERQKRSVYLRRLSAQKHYAYNKQYLSQKLEVLFEHQRQGVWYGYTDNYIRVACHSHRSLANQCIPVQLTKAYPDYVAGSIS